jgi:hypothetical protein
MQTNMPVKIIDEERYFHHMICNMITGSVAGTNKAPLGQRLIHRLMGPRFRIIGMPGLVVSVLNNCNAVITRLKYIVNLKSQLSLLENHDVDVCYFNVFHRHFTVRPDSLLQLAFGQ